LVAIGAARQHRDAIAKVAAESPGKVLIAEARALFAQLSQCHDNTIDVGKCTMLIEGLWPTLAKYIGTLPTDCRFKVNMAGKLVSRMSPTMASEVAKNIPRFDADGDGRLTLSELLRMLTVKPWRDLMVPSVAHEMQFELLRMHKSDDKANPIVMAIKEIFSRADVDGDGAVDQFELAVVLKQAVCQGLLPDRYESEMAALQEARGAINRHDARLDAVLTVHCYDVDSARMEAPHSTRLTSLQ
jgi:Ca2+-binding EF-hand superfamily protein